MDDLCGRLESQTIPGPVLLVPGGEVGRGQGSLTPEEMSVWQDDAACRGHNPDWWVTAEASDKAGRNNNDKALTICLTCPVKLDCKQWGHDTGSVGMIYGGTKRTPRSARGSYMDNKHLRSSDAYSGSGSINRRPRPA